MNKQLIGVAILSVAVAAMPYVAAHATDEQQGPYTYPYVPTTYLIERNYDDWADQYDSETDLYNWYMNSRSYLAMDPVNEFNQIMQEGFLYRQNFDTIVGVVDASFESAALVAASQMLDGTYWSLSEHNDRFWNGLMATHNLTDIDDPEELDGMLDELTANIHEVYVLEWFTMLDRLVYHGYTTPEQMLADPDYWFDIACNSPLGEIPVGDAAATTKLTPQGGAGQA